jgi:hypothetical protein
MISPFAKLMVRASNPPWKDSRGQVSTMVIPVGTCPRNLHGLVFLFLALPISLKLLHFLLCYNIQQEETKIRLKKYTAPEKKKILSIT